MNPKYKKHEENYIKVYQNQTIEIRDEEKNFKSIQRGQKYIPYRRTKMKKAADFSSETI